MCGGDLPHGPVLPGRAVVHDGVDLGRVDAGLGEQPLARRDREVAHVLVGRGDVLAAQAELLDDHVLRDPGGSPISAAVIHRSGRYEAVACSPTVLTRRPRGRSG